ncbi:hypothetical protein HPB51_021102 [Rhipicephalus microplus]|uniref:Uncharacterized protein n=1 Tax=Rhipicephalus microplus TaxID=6941 RepID=A0A9J6E371_RHIMP|nr:hypothetical protein HPB51_021102 [Rhipicephalus microplus]
MRTLVQAISEMTALEELRAYWLCKAVDIGHFGNVIGSNKSLRTLEVRFQHCCEFKAHKRDRLPQDRNVIEPWVTGLTTNHTLERLSIDLSLFSPCECSSFMDAIAVNVSIITVTVRNIAPNGCLREVYSRMRHHKIHQQEVVEDHHVDLQDVEELYFPKPEPPHSVRRTLGIPGPFAQPPTNWLCAAM